MSQQQPPAEAAATGAVPSPARRTAPPEATTVAPPQQQQPVQKQTLPPGVGPFDVLVADDEDSNFSSHPGNYHFSEALRQLLPRYMAGLAAERNTILQLIRTGVQQGRGRFMKRKKKQAVVAAETTPATMSEAAGMKATTNESTTTATTSTEEGKDVTAAAAATTTTVTPPAPTNKDNTEEETWVMLTPAELTEFLRDVIDVLTKPVRELKRQKVAPLEPNQALSTHDVVFGADPNYAGNGQLLAIAQHQKMQELASCKQQQRAIDEHSLCYSIFYAIHAKGGKFYTWDLKSNQVFPVSGSPEYQYYGYDRELKRRINWLLRTGTTMHPPNTRFPPALVPPPGTPVPKKPTTLKAKTPKTTTGSQKKTEPTDEVSPPPGTINGEPWPPGWVRRKYARQSHQGYDCYWFSPAGKKFRSMPEVRNYFLTLEETENDEEKAFVIWKERYSKYRRRGDPSSSTEKKLSEETKSEETAVGEQKEEEAVAESQRDHPTATTNGSGETQKEQRSTGVAVATKQDTKGAFTLEERKCVMEGVELFGAGKWTKIKKHFEEGLKDRTTKKIARFWGNLVATVITSDEEDFLSWTGEERKCILEGIEKCGGGKWSEIKQHSEGKLDNHNSDQIKAFWVTVMDLKKAPSPSTPSVTNAPWTEEEKQCLQDGVEMFGQGKWTKIKQHFADGLKNRTTKSMWKHWKKDHPSDSNTSSQPQQQPTSNNPADPAYGAAQPFNYWQNPGMALPNPYAFGNPMIQNPQTLAQASPTKSPPTKSPPTKKRLAPRKIPKDLQDLAEKFDNRAALEAEIERLEQIVDNALVNENMKVVEAGVEAERHLPKLQQLLECDKFSRKRKK